MFKLKEIELVNWTAGHALVKERTSAAGKSQCNVLIAVTSKRINIGGRMAPRSYLFRRGRRGLDVEEGLECPEAEEGKPERNEHVRSHMTSSLRCHPSPLSTALPPRWLNSNSHCGAMLKATAITSLSQFHLTIAFMS